MPILLQRSTPVATCTSIRSGRIILYRARSESSTVALTARLMTQVFPPSAEPDSPTGKGGPAWRIRVLYHKRAFPFPPAKTPVSCRHTRKRAGVVRRARRIPRCYCIARIHPAGSSVAPSVRNHLDRYRTRKRAQKRKRPRHPDLVRVPPTHWREASVVTQHVSVARVVAHVSGE